MSAWVLLFSVAMAQNPPSAADLALCSQAQVTRLQRESVFSRQVDLATARSSYFPSASISQSLGHLSTPSSANALQGTSLVVEQKVVDFAALSNIEAKKESLAAEQHALDQRALELSIAAVASLSSMQALSNKLKELDRQRESFEELVRVLSAGDGIGVSDSNNLLQTKSTLLAITSNRKAAEIDLAKAAADFALKFGFRAPNFESLVVKNVTRPSVDRLPSIRSASASVNAIRGERARVNRNIWPTLSLRGSYTATRYDGSDLPTSPAKEGTASLVLDLSGLWKDGATRQAFGSIEAIRESSIKQERLSFETLLDAIDREMAGLEERLAILKEQVSVNERSRAVTKAKLKLGKLSFLELQQTETMAYQAALDRATLEVRKKELLLTLELLGLFSSRVSGACSLAR